MALTNLSQYLVAFISRMVNMMEKTLVNYETQLLLLQIKHNWDLISHWFPNVSVPWPLKNFSFLLWELFANPQTMILHKYKFLECFSSLLLHLFSINSASNFQIFSRPGAISRVIVFLFFFLKTCSFCSCCASYRSKAA